MGGSRFDLLEPQRESRNAIAILDNSYVILCLPRQTFLKPLYMLQCATFKHLLWAFLLYIITHDRPRPGYRFTAAVAEMLFQSDDSNLYILPALPLRKWRDGLVAGLRGRGAVTVGFRWIGGILQEVTVQVCTLLVTDWYALVCSKLKTRPLLKLAQLTLCISMKEHLILSCCNAFWCRLTRIFQPQGCFITKTRLSHFQSQLAALSCTLTMEISS